jgi:hypothetical protein
MNQKPEIRKKNQLKRDLRMGFGFILHPSSFILSKLLRSGFSSQPERPWTVYSVRLVSLPESGKSLWLVQLLYPSERLENR